MNNIQPKSFWERPEGTTGIAMAVGILFTALFLMYKFGDVLVKILQNTLHAMILGGVIMAVIGLCMNERFRLICSNAFKLAMRHLTSWFITIDPIGILENHIDEMDAQISKVAEHTTSLNGQKRKMTSKIESKVHEMEKHLKLAMQAEKSGNNNAKLLNSRSASRAEDVIKNLKKTHGKIEMLHNVLKNMLEKIKFLRDDTENLVENKKYEYDSIKAAHAAMSGAQKLLQGNDSQMAMFEMTMEYIADDIGMKVGEMESFMEMSEDFMTNVDLETGVMDERGLELLERFQNGDSILLAETDKKLEALKQQPAVKTEDTTTQVNKEFNSYFK
jgi:phage shock protein A